jgi:Ca-activated chloride channel homolog
LPDFCAKLRFGLFAYMSRNILFSTFLISILSLAVFAQSGRKKPAETPAPERPKVVFKPPVYVPPTPNTTPKPNEDDDDVIKVNSTLVPIPASIIDAQGRSVTNLKLEDFELMVDDQVAEISEISRSQSPVRLALLFDNSSSVFQAREFEKKAAIRFFKQVIRPDMDLAALFSVATISRLEQPLTRDVSQIVQSINTFPMPEGATALLDGVIKAANYLRTADGRRVIVIVSDGEDTLSDATFEDTVKAAQAANCQIYVVKTTDFENYKQTGTRKANANIRALTAERRMQELASQTGGAVHSPIDEKELDLAFNRISAELSDQYILNYYPSEQSTNGQFRTIALRIKNKENVTVRSRKGYYIR